MHYSSHGCFYLTHSVYVYICNPTVAYVLCFFMLYIMLCNVRGRMTLLFCLLNMMMMMMMMIIIQNKLRISARVYKHVFFRLLLGYKQEDDVVILSSSPSLSPPASPSPPHPPFGIPPLELTNTVDNLIIIMQNLINLLSVLVPIVEDLSTRY